MRIITIIYASIPMTLVFLFIDFLLEFFAKGIFNISITSYFHERDIPEHGSMFYLVNTALLWMEMNCFIFVYSLLRPGFKSTRTALFTAVSIFLCFSFLFLGHFVNLGLYPIQAYSIFVVFSLIEFPIASFVGINLYENQQERNR